MKQKKKSRPVWEDEFQDVSSFSRPETSRRPGPVAERPPSRRISPERRPPPAGRTSSRRPAPDWEIPQWEVSGGRRPQPTGSRRPPERRPASGPGRPKRTPGKQKKAVKTAARRTLVFFTVLLMAAVTAVLAIFLLFKVSSIQVTGDVIEGYDSDTIIGISGCEIGDNLFFLTTGDKEAQLREQLPYVGEAKLRRHFPGTLEIHITATHAAACVESGGSWIYIDSGGKILENRDQPENGLLQIQGITSANTMPGQLLDPEDQDLLYACNTIITALKEREMLGEFTSLNLTSLFDIRLIYQNRIEFLLGGVADLGYKVDFGCRSLSEQPETAKGVFDLSSAGQTKRATFTEGEIGTTAPAAPAASADPSATPDPGGAPSALPADTDQPGGGDDPSSQPNADYRNEGIPDHPFTGNAG